MKFTLSDLTQYLDCPSPVSVSDISKKLTSIGLEIESVVDQAQNLEKFSVAKIIDAIKVENYDKLNLCKVDIGNGELLQIVCGAKNARSGIKVIYAPIGSIIPSNSMVIKKTKIAGVESSGMLCSAQELNIGGDGEGIIEVDGEFSVGDKVGKVFGIDEVVFEVNVTPNRGDCLGVYGIARDLSAAGFGELKKLNIKRSELSIIDKVNVENRESKACNFIAFRVLKNVKNSVSPKWLQDKLNLVGINPISAVVDVTNYVMYLLNRPMHAYDFDKISGNITIRYAADGEKFLSLQGKEIVLNKDNLVIADDAMAISIAGIIGSKTSSIGDNTQNILLEAANFKADIIYKSGKDLNIQTESKYRFERGVDYKTCIDGIELATKMILEICGDGVEVGYTEVYEDEKINQIEQQSFIFNLTRIKKLIGLDIPEATIVDILTKLEFAVKSTFDDHLTVTAPSHRSDILDQECLIEEVIRIYGYDKIIAKSMDCKILPNNDITNKIRIELASLGLTETINWSFIDVNLAKYFGKIEQSLLLANPISSSMNYMRHSLLIGLLQSYKKNQLRNFTDLSLFEIGQVFEGVKIDDQKLMASGIRVGKSKDDDSYHDTRDFDIFDIKSDILNVIESLGVNPKSLHIDKNTDYLPKYYHPYRSAILKLGKTTIAYFGEVHPFISKQFDIKNRVNAFEIFVDNITVKSQKNIKKAFICSDLQQVSRDFAFIVKGEQRIDDIIKDIRKCDNLINEVTIFDIYTGDNVESGKKSIAARVKIQPQDKTLTTKEIDDLSTKIIDSVERNFSAILRV